MRMLFIDIENFIMGDAVGEIIGKYERHVWENYVSFGMEVKGALCSFLMFPVVKFAVTSSFVG